MTTVIKKFAHFVTFTALFTAPITASAELLLSDDFSYTVGNLYNQGDWVKLTPNTAEPIKVVDQQLTYPGYQNTAAGKAVVLNGGTSTSAQRLQKGFSTDAITSGTLYYSMLVKPTAFTTSINTKYVISGFSGKNFNGWGDGVGNTSIYATISINAGSTDGKFKFGFAASTSTPTKIDTDYDLNQTYLVVIKYEFSTKNISIWINPESSSAEATKTLTNVGSISTTNGVQAICLYQGSSSNVQANVVVSDVRVATTMADLFESTSSGGEQGGEEQGGEENKATATISPTTLNFGSMFQDTASEAITVEVKGENITGPLTISTTNSAFTATPSTLSAEEALAGATVSVVFKPTSGITYNGALKVYSGETELASATLSGKGIEVTKYQLLTQLSDALYSNALTNYSYVNAASNSATVTYVDLVGKRFFLQDMTGAIEVLCDYVDMPENLEIGNKVTSLMAMVENGGYIGQQLHLYYPIAASDIKTGQPKTPTTVTINNIQDDPEYYWNKLVTIDNLSFANESDPFKAAAVTATNPNGQTISIRPFNGSNIIGFSIPKKANMTGILIAKNGTTLWPRTYLDMDIIEQPTTGIDAINADENPAPTIYNLQGIRIKNGAPLSAGLYIVNGKLTIIK